MVNLGDVLAGATVRFLWSTYGGDGASITRGTNGTVSVYKDASTTQSTTGVTDTEDFDGLTGIHYAAIDTSADGTFYSPGSTFTVVLSGATIDGKSINAVLATFTIENRPAPGIYQGSVTGSPTTTSFADSGLTQNATDFWKGRIVVFTSGALKGQATDITAFTPASDTLTFSALTAAPTTGDRYVIV